MRMKLLITILTTSDLELLDLCYASVLRQLIPREMRSVFTYDVVIIVNSLDAAYPAAVRARYPGAKVVDSVSNGKPGKGHNAEIDYFREHPEYDWLFPVDGDDLLFTTALWQLGALLSSTGPTFDVLLFLGLDRVSFHAQPGSVIVSDKIYLTTAFEEANHMMDPDTVLRNPFIEGATIRTMSCPTRICVLNRAAANAKGPRLAWDEAAPMLEDFPPLLASLAHHLKGSLRLAGTSNRHIYLYNQLNSGNATTKFKSRQPPPIDADHANAAFLAMIAPFRGTAVESRYTDLRTIPFVKTDDNPLFLKTMRHKIGFIQNTLVKEYMRRYKVVAEALAAAKRK